MSDSVRIMECPKCNSRFDVSKFAIGQKFLCKKCKQLIVVPENKTSAPETAVTLPFFVETPPTGGGASYAGSASDFEGALSKDSIGGCKLTKLLGRGGMGAVFLGTQISLDRPVAVKILPKSFASNKDNVSRFEREARAVARLNHPNIVQVFDMGQDAEGTYFIVMEYVEGSTLSDLLKERSRLPEKMALGAITQACAGIQAAHEAGILHRDIKPENLMLNVKGRIKIADFGLAKHVSGSVRLTGTGIALGTPAFMAPEQGMGEDVDARADIYSLGGTLFTLLSGRLPFVADSPLSMMMKHATEPIPRVTDLVQEISKATEDIILKALAKSPKDRFATAADMRKALLEAKRKAASGPRGVEADIEIEDLEAEAPKKTPTPPAARADDRKSRTPKPPQEKQKTPQPPKIQHAEPEKPRKEPEKETPKTPEHAAKKKFAAAKPQGREAAKKSGFPLTVAVAAVVLILGVVGIIAVASSGGDKDSNQSKPSGAPEPDKGPGDRKPEGSGSKNPSDGEARPDDTGIKPPFLPENVAESSAKGEYVNRKDGSILLWIPGGEFERGLAEEDISSVINWYLTPVYSDYRAMFPVNRPRVRGFFIAKNEVSNRQYGKFVEWAEKADDLSKVSHPHEPLGKKYKSRYADDPAFNDPDQPVVGVDWFDAYAYSRWAGMDIPTEAQWEKAALWDPLKKKRLLFPWGDKPGHDKAAVADFTAGSLFKSSHLYVKWLLFEKGRDKCAVKKVTDYIADMSPYGGLNFAGNVVEWVKDYFDQWFYGSPDASRDDPFNNIFSPYRGIRGAGYKSNLEMFLKRRGLSCEEGKGRFQDLGFRCALNLVENPRKDEGRGVSDPDEIKKFEPASARRIISGNIEQKLLLKQYDDAAVLAKTGEKMFPDSWEFPYYYGRARQLAADADKAEERRTPLFIEAAASFEKSAELDPLKERKARSYAQKGQCLRLAKKYPEALEEYNRSAAIDPNQANAFYYRGLLRLFNLKEFEQARSDFKNALSFDPDSGNIWYYVAEAEEQLKNLEAAVSALGNSLILNADDIEALFKRGELLVKLDKTEEAASDFALLIKKRDVLHGYLGMARIHMKKGEWQKAMDACDSAMNEYPVRCEMHFQEARAIRIEAKSKLDGK